LGAFFVITDFKGKTAVLTGAGSGFGLECARIGAKLGMNLVLADVQQDALDKTVAEMQAAGAPVLAMRVDVSKADQMQAFADAAFKRFGAPHFVFNNAGVGAGGLVWENTLQDWEWVLGVNLMGVVHGVRLFTPMMLAAANADPSYQGHIVNTASMAGLLNAPNMGIYNVSKHAVVSLSETLYQDLALVTDQISASVLCPFFVPTGISQSHRNRPGELSSADAKPTRSQLIGQAMSDKAVSSGKVTAAEVAQMVFDAIGSGQFYIYSHPKSIGSVQTRLEDVLQARNPTDPFAHKPELGVELRKALRA
jgi:NAD(P)-dependent dehydrogenase (short-subunit alcohol dehydrogenase family)